MATFTIPSLTDPDKRYQVSIVGNGSCTCKDWQYRRAEKGEACRHIVQARQEQAERLALIAGTVEDHRLQPLIEKHTSLKNWPIVLACLAEQWDRWELERPQPVAAPVLAAVLVRARAWGRQQNQMRLHAPCTSALDNARLRTYAELAEAERKNVFA